MIHQLYTYDGKGVKYMEIVHVIHFIVWKDSIWCRNLVEFPKSFLNVNENNVFIYRIWKQTNLKII